MKRLIIETAEGDVSFTLTHRSRVTRRLHMELDENGGLVVVAPKHWSGRQVRSILSANSTRVSAFLDRARAQQLPRLSYTAGEIHFFLGMRYPLVIHSTPGKTRVGVEAESIHMEMPVTTPEKVRAGLHNWYRQQASALFSQRLRSIGKMASWVEENNIELRLRKMKRSWGNCSSTGVVKLNTHLIKAPAVLIDYVIAHELCHLKEMNHSAAFYALQQKLNPGFKAQRAMLKSNGYRYLHN